MASVVGLRFFALSFLAPYDTPRDSLLAVTSEDWRQGSALYLSFPLTKKRGPLCSRKMRMKV